MASSKLSAKAARLDFSSLPGTGLPALPPVPPADGAMRPKTAPGAMMAFANDARSELMRENDQLRSKAAESDHLRGRLDDALGELQQWDGAKAARLIDPTLVEPSRFANRHELNYAGPEFAALRAEIESAGGNVQPIKLRSVATAADGPARYEVVFGHRRHRACLELGLPVLAVIDNLDDRALFVEMDRENRARKDLSAWEQGMMYRRALQQGLFPSNRKLAEAIGVDLSALGKALALADLPEPLVQAFASPLGLQFRWAKPLAAALKCHRDAVLRRAAELAQLPPDRKPKAVFDALMAAAGQGVERFHPPQTLALEVDGAPAGEVSVGSRGEVTVFIEAGLVPAHRLAALAKLVDGFLRDSATSKP
ncbi:MAG: ParB/RepB/Spo0J family partition protein [Aquabacterium sp.]|nr:ParB/RepB/Spo0J family partition protein [Aquabacterium sp.]